MSYRLLGTMYPFILGVLFCASLNARVKTKKKCSVHYDCDISKGELCGVTGLCVVGNRCVSDADCVKVPSGCCKCASGEQAINKAHLKVHHSHSNCAAKKVQCPETNHCVPGLEPVCSKGKCVLSFTVLPEEPSVDTTCEGAPDCALDNHYFTKDGRCCTSCTYHPVSASWQALMLYMCAHMSKEGCPQKKCAGLPAVNCVKGSCVTAPAE